jgi:glutamine synthetase
VNTLLAVYKYNGLLKASIMSANNAHRLGANEAPPAIISVFLGKQISAVLDKIEHSSEDDDITVDELKKMKLGVAHIPEVLIDNTDRNRTSPFAFTGNRFEFRAVGSSANCSSAMTALNSVVAAQLIDFKKEIDTKMKKGMKMEQAIFDTLRLYIKASKPIRFEGNNYSEEWKEEAAKRGLDCETSVPIIYDAYTSPQSVEMFESIGVLNKKELHARNEVKWETYTKKIQIEARVLGDLCMNHIIPVATEYQSMLLDNLFKMRAVFDKEKADRLSREDAALIEEIADHISAIKTNVDDMIDARKVANKLEDAREKAVAYHDTVEVYFNVIRYHVDKLELIVDNQMWTLPKYRELLFIS